MFGLCVASSTDIDRGSFRNVNSRIKVPFPKHSECLAMLMVVKDYAGTVPRYLTYFNDERYDYSGTHFMLSNLYIAKKR